MRSKGHSKYQMCIGHLYYYFGKIFLGERFMSAKISKNAKNTMDKENLQHLTRQQLKELEEKEKTGWQTMSLT